jgi:hypothetical protein
VAYKFASMVFRYKANENDLPAADGRFDMYLTSPGWSPALCIMCLKTIESADMAELRI